MKNNSIKYRIPVCIFLFVSGTIIVDFNSPQKSTHYNPLQVIIDDVNKGNLDAAQRSMWDFVTFLVEKNDHTEPIWTNGECAVIAAAVMCVVYDNKDHPEYQNLTNVYNFIANMCKTVNKVMPIDAYMNKLPDSHPAKSLMAIAKIAPDKMGGSFFTSALTTLRLYITNDMYNITKESEFSLEDMGAKPKQALFYLLPDQKTTYYPIVSLLVAQQYEQLVTYAKTRGNRLPNRVNFILDEFGNFTAIPDIQSKMTVGGGYGIRWNLFIQDFNQLIDKYGQEVAKIIQSNCHFWIYLHSQDNSTNKEISDRLAITANAEGGELASSKAVTGTKALLNDLSNVLLVVAPIAGTACVIYFAVRHGAADEMDQKKWKQRIIVAVVSIVIAVVASALIKVLVSYYQ